MDKTFCIESVLPDEIWFDNEFKDKIGIDTGNRLEEGRVSCLRLDEIKIFHIE